MMRKALAAAAALALLVVLYAATGYWIAPGYVREALAELAARHGLTLELVTVETKPFTLRVELDGIALRGPQGRVFAEAESAFADLAWASLWRRGWIVEELRLVAPEAALGKLPEFKSTGERGAPPAITVQALTVESGRLRHDALDFAFEALTLNARNLSTLDAAAGTYEAAARLAEGAGQLASRGTVALAPFAAEGTLSVAALRAAQLLPKAEGQLEGSARYVYAGGNFTLHDVSLAGDNLAYEGMELLQATLHAPEVPVPPQEPFQAAGQASVTPHGKIAAQGSVGFAPFRADLKVALEALLLPQAQRWLPERVALDVASGALSGEGRLQIAGDTTSYRGSAAIRDLRLEERDSGALLLAWQLAETASLDVELSPLRVVAGEIVARAPEGRLIIESDGSVNFATLFAGGEGANGEPLHAAFERLRIEEGTLHFADRSLDNPFEVTIRKLSGGVSGFSTAAGEPARVRLTGRVPPYGSARIRGTIDLNSPTSLADITANFRNLRLEAFNPYIAKFAGYRIESGRLSAQLRYEVREGRLVGTNELAFEQMQLGEKLETKGLLDVPLELAVALLADAQGRIDLDIPVRGNLKDPQFDIGAIVARAFGNVLRKIVSAPFRALAALFGGKDRDPGVVPFDPGSAALSPPAEEDVALVAKALEERPRLGVAVHGGYDPARDLEALRLRTARQEVAREAGIKGSLDFGDPKVVHAAERLYLKRVGDRVALEALRKSNARYGRALLHSIAASLPAQEAEAQALARSRAEAVRAALIDHGVEPARVRVAEPAQEKAGEEGVPSTLSLTADVPAAAQASIDPTSRETVGRVQRSLKAEGLDPGPIDGILGPRTRRAIIKFQGAQGLELTGELDARTLRLILSAA